MNGQIIIPQFYLTRFTDDYKLLLALVADHYGWSLSFSNYPYIKNDTRVVLLYATPHHMRPFDLNHLSDLPDDVFLIAYMKDIHNYNRREVLFCMKNMFDRADLILSPAKTLFQSLYPEYIDKMKFMPDCFGMYERYSDLGYNKNPVNRCLLSGDIDKDKYPLRYYVMENRTDKIDYLGSPYPAQYGNVKCIKHDIIGDRYAKMLHTYFANVTDVSIFNYALGKHFEIPASGSLLVSDICPDMKTLGFVPGENFVEINESNCIDVIQDIVSNPEKYESIRKSGYDFVMNSHNIHKRLESIKQVINESIN